MLHTEINNLKDEILELHERESALLNEVKILKESNITKSGTQGSKDEIYLVGSSILKEVRTDDLVNGTVKSISGGKIKDIKEDLLSLRIKPKIIISQIGGSDLDSDGVTVDDTMANYVMALTETKVKFPETKLVIAGLPPRHKSLEIRTKVKDYNKSMKQWCEAK